MLWVAFIVWIAYGVWQTRRSHIVRERALAVQREKRAIFGALLYIFGTLALFGGLALVFSLVDFTKTFETVAGWVAIILLGLAFVHAVTMATALLVTLVHPGVTNDPHATSTHQNSLENQNEEPPA